MAAKKSKIGVDEFMAALDHPYKADVETMRAIINAIDPRIAEQVKWNAPSYSLNGVDMVTFNLWAKDKIHLVFHHAAVVGIDSPILEGDYPNRRMSYFYGPDDIRAKQSELERVLRDLIAAL